MAQNDKIQAGWRLPDNLKQEFIKFADKPIEDEFAAAVYLYMKMPKNIRELAKLEIKSRSIVSPQFWDTFAGALREGIQVQLSIREQKQRILRKK